MLEGKSREVLMALFKDDPDISILVLGVEHGARGTGAAGFGRRAAGATGLSEQYAQKWVEKFHPPSKKTECIA